jgi:outer membrane receptor protein involved in Fe transport
VAAGIVRAENPAEALERNRVEVIGTTPLPGLGLPLSQVPANVQIFSPGPGARASTLPDFLDGNAASAVATSGQGNAFQPDFAYRGFTASPLLGLPQGLAVFQDGVRANEPFGDVVNWDLIPSSAIASIQLIPGTAPVFGPNTLGGALAVYTKSGAQFPGGSVEVHGGSWGHRAVEAEQGGSRGPWDYFVMGNVVREDGWAEHDASRVNQLFAKVGHQTDESDLDVSLTLADNRLDGIQALPRSFLDDIRQPYTWPDRNTNRASLLTVKGSRFVDEGVLAGATAYVRKYRNDNFSSNVADPDSGLEATNEEAVVDQWSYGIGAQLTFSGKALGRGNQLVVGASADRGDSRFTRHSQPARFDGSRGTEATGPFTLETDAAIASTRYGAFVSDTFNATERWVLTLSARADRTVVGVGDRSGEDPGLEGRHEFSRVNPAIGLNFVPSDRFTAYAGYSEGMRAPTAVELTCADPSAPCKLPNNFLSDPPLNAVVAKTFEAGARGKPSPAFAWSAAAYRTSLSDDILFVSSSEGAPTTGYFRNVGATRRQGLELSASLVQPAWKLALQYGLVDATFRAPYVEPSPDNSSADADGNIVVPAGARIPGIPRHSLKVSLDLMPVPEATLGLSLRAASAIHARGDENNRDVNGRVPGFAVLDLRASWRPGVGFEAYLQVDNVFDRRYATAGILGRNFFTGPGHAFAPDSAVSEPFLGVGAPFGAWVGVRYAWK